uniref:Tail protein n=1 Tax=Siphoviridae sp. ctFPV4 TaxID=2827819 RepID=A0A8S5SJD2_9CAUD|nr:MAG TPA: tail protein [Siphoviridae sp. ctFPV4]
MLTLYSGGKGYPIQNDDYYIREIPGGLNEVIFNISIWDELYPLLTEEANIREGEGQLYLIKQIDGGAQAAKVVCQLDLDEWRSEMLLNYTNGSATVNQTISGILPNGWTIQDRALLNIRRTIEGNYTPFEVVQACQETYGVQVQFDNKTKAITLFFAENEKPLGAFATRDLNLKEINYKGKSTNFATRLYAYGKDGLSFASINDGKPYVDDNTYSSRVICAYWKDERYEVAENLLEDAKKNLASMAVPQRSYDCNVIDLAATNPEMYGFQDFSMFSVITLIDDSKNARINHQVVERWNYPYYPEKNKVILSTVVPKIQSQIVQVQQQINNPNSNFQQIQQSKIDNATNWLTGADGYVIAVKDDNGTWKEILFLDTPSAETAKNVLRINTNGIGFSTNGVNGPYRNAWTIDGSLVADFITTGTLNAALAKIINIDATNINTGTLNADLIKAGNIKSKNEISNFDLSTGIQTYRMATNLLDGYDVEMYLWANSIKFRAINQTTGESYELASIYASLPNSGSNQKLAGSVEANSIWIRTPTYAKGITGVYGDVRADFDSVDTIVFNGKTISWTYSNELGKYVLTGA